MATRIEKINESFSKLYADTPTCEKLHESLKFFDPRAVYSPLFKRDLLGRRKWDGKSSLFDLSNDLIPNGLIFATCKILGGNVTLSKDVPGLYAPIQLDWKSIPCKYEPKAHQVRLIETALKHRRATLRSATNSGKSLSLYMLSRAAVNAGLKVLIVVPTTMLIDQMIGDFEDYSNGGFRVDGLCNDIKPRQDAVCIVSTWHSAILKDTKWLQQFHCLFVDECHGATGASIKSLAFACTNAYFRIGVSGSIPKDPLLNKTIEACFGPTVEIVDSQELVRVGFSSQLTAKTYEIRHACDVELNFQGEMKIAIGAPHRLQRQLEVLDSIRTDKNVLILCNTIKQCQAFVNAIPGAHLIIGTVGKKARADKNRVKAEMEALTNQVLVSTYGSLSTGVSIKNIDHLIQGSPVGANVAVSGRLIQTLGRIARVSATKSTATLHDFCDIFPHSKHLKNQFKKRLKLYANNGVII